jgi:hypothetical protein
MGDLHDHVTHSSFASEVTEIVDWVGKRDRTIEFLETLQSAVPGNVGLRTALDDYRAAYEHLQENPPPAEAFSQPAAFAGSAAASGTGDGGGKFQMRPWMWMVLGALGLLLVVGLVVGSDPMERGDDADLDALWDRCATQDFVACDNLFEDSVDDSGYESFATSCGNLTLAGNPLDMRGGCVDYIDDLEFMASECEQGFFDMCDNLYLASPDGTFYEQFGSSCGGLTVDAILLDEQGDCVSYMADLDS